MEHKQIPSVGRIVHFKLPSPENYYGPKEIFNNGKKEGDVLPAIIVAVWGTTPEAAVNLRVLCDGANDAWITSICAGDGSNQWSWPPRV